MRRALDLVGRVFIAIGLILLLFVAYQLWGTGLIEARQQSSLKDDFREELAAAGEAEPAGDSEAPPTRRPPSRPVPGDAVALLEIDKIGLERAIVEGVEAGDLRKGPGHYPTTVLPGQQGNAGIAGHRTTYGAPFGDLDELEPGDAIDVTTVEGDFVYTVREKLIVTPEDVEVLTPTDHAQLTLTTCHPKFSARQRLIVVADLDEREGDDATEATVEPTAVVGDLDAGEDSGWGAVDVGTVVWFAALVLVGVGWWLLHRGRRHWSMTLAGALPFLIVLWFVFGEVERLLPANF